jgi:hypothetical protein
MGFGWVVRARTTAFAAARAADEPRFAPRSVAGRASRQTISGIVTMV